MGVVWGCGVWLGLSGTQSLDPLPLRVHDSFGMDRRMPTPKASTPASPCVRDCCLDEAEVCMGCGRSLQEILRWQAASDEEREIILAAAKLRLDERQARRRW